MKCRFGLKLKDKKVGLWAQTSWATLGPGILDSILTWSHKTDCVYINDKYQQMALIGSGYKQLNLGWLVSFDPLVKQKQYKIPLDGSNQFCT